MTLKNRPPLPPKKPDLLAACELIEYGLTTPHSRSEWEPITDQLFAAITKARGEQVSE